MASQLAGDLWQEPLQGRQGPRAQLFEWSVLYIEGFPSMRVTQMDGLQWKTLSMDDLRGTPIYFRTPSFLRSLMGMFKLFRSFCLFPRCEGVVVQPLPMLGPRA